MAVLPTTGKVAPKRRPTLKGNVMVDVSQGNERARVWPRGRGKPKTLEEKKRQDKFRAANEATKYMAPQIVASFTDAVRATPLLPRDLLISQLYDRLASFILEDGKERFPMVARTDVSESLDAISNTPGTILQRGDQWWEPRALGPGTIAPWQQIADITISTPSPTVNVTDLDGFSEIFVTGWNTKTASSTNRIIGVSTDNGATFYKTSGNYQFIADTGIISATTGASYVSTNSASDRSGCIHINKFPPTGFPVITCLNRGTCLTFTASPSEINAIQLWNTNGFNFTGGRLIVCAR